MRCSARQEAAAFLAPKPVGFIYGVGHVSAAKLAADGYRLIADLQRADEHDLMRRYGEEGARLWRLARGIDARAVDPERETKSISAETTFERDIGDFRPLEQHLWDLTERVSARLKANALCRLDGDAQAQERRFQDPHAGARAGRTRPSLPRASSPPAATCSPEVGRTRFRLIGIGVSHLQDAAGDDLADLLDRRTAEAEHAVDRLRAKFGRDAVVRGLALEDD